MRSLLLASSALCAGALLAAGPIAAASLSIPFGPIADQQTDATLSPPKEVTATITVPDDTVSFDRLDLTLSGDLGFTNEFLEVILNGVSLGTILDRNGDNDRFNFPTDGGVGSIDFSLEIGRAVDLDDVPITSSTTLQFKPSEKVSTVDINFFDERDDQFGPTVFPKLYAYAVEGGLTVTVPDVWIAQSNGAFDDGANWEAGVSPSDGSPAPVFINPDLTQTIAGPEGFVTLQSLELGAGDGRATLDMQGGTLAVEGDVLIAPNGRLGGDGVLIGGGLPNDFMENFGRIDGEGLTIEGLLRNAGRMTGGGVINGGLLNVGTIEILPEESLEIATHPYPDFGDVVATNAGRIDVVDGVLRSTPTFQNIDDGEIKGDDAVLVMERLDNNAEITLTGDSRILGEVRNNRIDNPAFGFVGRIANIGSGQLTFFDAVLNEGEIETAPGGSVVFLDSYSGSGDLTGGGEFSMRGLFSPGSSPGLTTVIGDLTLTEESLFELGGLQRGTGYDATDVDGVLTLGGHLNIVNFDDFAASPGDRFTLFMASEILGDFASISFPDLDAGSWRTFRTATTFGVEAVPLPAAGWMMLAGIGALAALRRRAA